MIEYKPDNIDWKILNILQSDAGISNLGLSEKVCLSPSGGPRAHSVRTLVQRGRTPRRHLAADLDAARAGNDRVMFARRTFLAGPAALLGARAFAQATGRAEVSCPAGRFTGERFDGIARFRGIRYGRA